ncbi:MAG: DUF3604 domain-containing protein, partial [Halioglobus sp.]|nr:DUF3604 domain-containing protein [Halioglobus sp.]
MAGGLTVLRALAAGVLAIVLVACGGIEPPPDSVYAAREFGTGTSAPCAERVPTRKALFGDLHVHTAYSNDAWNFDVRVYPRDAYRYAFGEPIRLPLGDDFEARTVRIDRPLDFMGVTDHAEFFGEQSVCFDEQADGYASKFCEVMRSGEGRAPALIRQIISPFSRRNPAVCGDDGADCARRSEQTWQDIIAAAQQYNDTSSDCQRTTFIAYEYSSFRMGSNLHRNVVFRNSAVLNRPVSYIDENREWDLWRVLKQQCIDGDTGCDVIAIPHNSNISNGRMFAVDYPGARSGEAQAERAALRQYIEPLVEIMQHKGDSECRNGLEGVLGAVDELCDFEPFENLAFERIVGEGEEIGACYDGPFADWILRLGPSCLDRNSYARQALVEGLLEEARIGVNPFKFGLMASTDTHNGIGGGVQEGNFPGHLGNGDSTAQQRVQFDGAIPGNASNNPGGLIGVWAEENSRDAIFESMRRREVFGTSGPRIEPRFFGGWDLDPELCNSGDMLRRAYASAVPMGSDLAAAPGDATAPQFLVAAAADLGTAAFPGVELQRLQVIKGWADAEG